MAHYGSHQREAPSREYLANKAQEAFEQNDAAIKQSIEDNLKVKDGKLFGLIPVPPEFTRAVNTILMPLTSYLSKNSADFVYNQTKSLAENKFFEKHFEKSIHANAAQIGKWAGAAALWGIIAARPIGEFIDRTKKHALKRYNFSKEITGVCEATGADYKTNEVVKAATNAMNAEWYTDMKSLVPGLIGFGVQVPFALQNHNQFMKSCVNDIALSGKKTAMISKGVSPEEAQRQAVEALEIENISRLNSSRERFFSNSSYKEGSSRGEAAFKHFWNTTHGNIDETAAKAAGDGVAEKLLNKNTLLASVGFLSEDIDTSLQRSAAIAQKNKRANSYQLIQEMSAEGDRHRNVHAAVVDIFQQLEVDMGRPQFAGPLLRKLEESTQLIADRIEEGRLDPLALLKLAGEHKVVKHGASGKRDFCTEKEIEASVGELLGNKIGKGDGVSADEFIATFANPLLAKETLKKNLCELQGEERDFFIAVMPSELLQQAGLNMTEINERRRAAHAKLYDEVAVSVLHIADQAPELLSSYGMPEEEIAHIKKLSRHILAGDMEQLKIEVDSRGALLTDVAQVTLGEQLKGEKPWAARVKEGKSLKATIEKALSNGEKHAGEAIRKEAPHASKTAGEESRRAHPGEEGAVR